MSGGPISQDWEPVVIRKKAPNAAAKKDEKAVNAARRSGAEIETLKKATTGTNKAASSSTTLNTRKLDEETENLALFKSHKNPSKTEKVSTSNQCGNHRRLAVHRQRLRQPKRQARGRLHGEGGVAVQRQKAHRCPQGIVASSPAQFQGSSDAG
ncbi:hypothetical protein PS2_028078 [Malus domestica]